MVEKEILSRGAEAVIYRENGEIIKERVKKSYRAPELDEKLLKERIKEEERLLKRALNAGVKVPKVLGVEGREIRMEYIDGERLRKTFEDREDLWKKVGKDVGRLHAQNIIHGDITTSNILLKKSSGDIEKSKEKNRQQQQQQVNQDVDVYFIDFGLSFYSERIEDKATDLRLLKQVLEATHNKVSDESFKEIFKGYRDIMGEEAEEVLQRLEELEKRTRYN